MRELRGSWVPHPPQKEYLWKHHGITPEEWWQLYRSQNGVCAICGIAGRRLHVDHDHRTPKRFGRKAAIRGMLCWIHNAAIQAFRDNPAHMKSGAGYVSEPPAHHLWIDVERGKPRQGELFPEET